jgi:hypothetical protein
MINQRCRHQGRGSVFNRFFTSSIDKCAAAWVTLAIPFLPLLCDDLLLILPQIADWYDNPDALDITRSNNKHLSFGHGVHYCLGAPLARLEGQIAISTLLQRLPNLHLSVAPDQLRWRGAFVLRGLEALPVGF